MIITIPENISDITLRQFQQLTELLKNPTETFDREKVKIFTGFSDEQILSISISDFNRISGAIDTALSVDVQFKNTFSMGDVEFGFIPNLDRITMGEFADMGLYGVAPETLHNLMAILFRPITKKISDNYDIQGYAGTEEWSERMKDMPLNIVNGSLVFFCDLAMELTIATQKFSTMKPRRAKKQRTISKGSAGILPLKNWLKTMFSKLTKF